MRPIGIRVISSVLAGAVVSGCSSSYVPARSPEISVITDGGSMAFVRDGKKYEAGFLGGNIETVVHGVPQAEDYARSYRSGMVGGFTTVLLGAAGMIGGLSAMGAEASQDQSAVPGLAVAVGGLAAYLVGFALMLNAQPHVWDAINSYNDAVRIAPAPSVSPAPAPPAPAPPPAPPAATDQGTVLE